MRLSRRAFLTGESPGGGVHISSLVVHCRPEYVPAVIENIEALPEAEVPEHSAEGKLVVLLETANENIIMQRIGAIENMAGVINAALVYHQIDNDPGNSP